MSILSTHLTAERVLIGVDTRGAAAEGMSENARATIGTVNCHKAAYLPALGAVLAGRGTPSLLQLVSSQSMLSGHADFDALVGGLPAMLKFGFTHMLDVARRSGLTVDLTEQEILAAGYSAQAGRMVGYVWAQESRAAGFERYDLEDGSAWQTPWWAAEDPPECDTPEAMLRLARLQVAAARERRIEAIGGKLIVADVRRNGVSFNDLGPIDEPGADPA